MQCSGCGSAMRDDAGICLACGEIVRRKRPAGERLQAAEAGVPAWIAFEGRPVEPIDYPASRLARVLAAIIDAVLLGFLGVVLAIAIGGEAAGLNEDGKLEFNLARTIVFFSLNAGYFIAFPASPWQGTPGKHLMGLRIVSLDGGRLTVLHAAARWLCQQICFGVIMPLAMLVSVLGVIAVPIAFLVLMGGGRSPWDWMAGTKVVD